MNTPAILNNDNFLDAPLNYKWDNDTSGFYRVDAKNEKIAYAMWRLNHKASLGIVAALCEWIYWRMSKHIDKPIAKQCIESQWACIIDKRYSFKWKYGVEYISDRINGPIWTMLSILAQPISSYYDGLYFYRKVDNLALLAQHISPDKKLFDTWFQDTLRKAAEFFPCEYDPEDIVKNPGNYKKTNYDSSHEPAIPREFFFDPEFDYETADNALLINQFLSGLDYENNKLLNSPEKMLELGFKGTPYQY